MELNEILSIAGAPGLYKYVAQGKNGIIVESLVDGHRTMVSGTAKVSALGDIAVFTQNTEMPLGEVFQAIFDKSGGKEVPALAKATPAELKAFMESFVPDFDQDRVHNSDIKKIAQWYNTLVAAGMTSFKTEEEAEEETAEGEKKPAKPKTTASKAAAGASAAAKKQAAPKAASGSKAPTKRSTTARKAQ